jgi:EAL domain-containing protein (putative c-di-GMP-specific phosphodiesterase class I)
VKIQAIREKCGLEKAVFWKSFFNFVLLKSSFIPLSSKTGLQKSGFRVIWLLLFSKANNAKNSGADLSDLIVNIQENKRNEHSSFT